jgi:hypothetical protein
VTIQCQAVENGPYLNDTTYDTLAFELFQEVKYQIKQASKADFDGFSYVGELTPSGVERSSDAQDNSTETWAQYAGTVPVGALLVP